MKHVQFELESGEIVNAVLSDCGLFCDKCSELSDSMDVDMMASDSDRFHCAADIGDIINLQNFEFKRKWRPQARPACQVAAQKVKSD